MWSESRLRARFFADPTGITASVGALILVFALVSVVLNVMSALLVLVMCLLGIILRVGAKHFPQTTGTIVSMMLVQLLAVVASTALTPILVVHRSYELGSAFVLAPILTILLTLVVPHDGVHRGWTVFFSHLPMLVGIFLLPVFPVHASLLACASTFCGVVVVLLRSWRVWSMKSPRPRRLVKTAAVGMIALITAGMGMLATTPQAQAFDWFGADKMLCGIVSPNLTPQPVGNGMETIMAPQNLAGLKPQNPEASSGKNLLDTEMSQMQNGADLDNYTLFEVSGLRGLNYINWIWDNQGEATQCAFQPWMSVFMGNLINKFGLFGLQITIVVKEYSQTTDPFKPLYEALNPVVSAFLSVAFGLISIAYLIGLAIFALRAWKGGDIAHVAKNASGAVMTAFVASVAYAGLGAGATVASWDNPSGNGFYTVMGVLDKTAATINSAVADEVFFYIPDSDATMCKKIATATPTNAGQRYSSCLMAESLAYHPWALATFGPAAEQKITPSNGVQQKPWDAEPADEIDPDDDNAPPPPLPCYNNYDGCEDMRTYLIAQIGGPDITPNMTKCLKKNDYDVEGSPADNYTALAACNPYYTVAADLMHKEAEGSKKEGSDVVPSPEASAMSAYRGGSAGANHITQSLMTLISTFTVGLGIAAFAVATVYWHARLLLLFITGPIILAFGAFRGAEEAKTWIANVIQTAAVRIIYGVMTTLIIFTVAVVTTMEELSAGYRMLILGILIFSCMNILRKANEWSRIGNADGDPMKGAFTGTALGTMTGQLAPRALGALGRKTGQIGIGAARIGAVGAMKGGGALASAGGKGASVLSRPVRRKAGKAVGELSELVKEKQGELKGKIKDKYGSPRYEEELGDFDNRQRLRVEDRARKAADSFDGARIADPEIARRASATGFEQIEDPGPIKSLDRPSVDSMMKDRDSGTTFERTKRGVRLASENVRRAQAAVKNTFSDDIEQTAVRDRYRKELARQLSAEKAEELGVEKLSRKESRDIRRRVQDLTDEQVAVSTRGLTKEQQMKRLLDMRQEREEEARLNREKKEQEAAAKEEAQARKRNKRQPRS